MEELKLLIGMVNELPTLAVWVLLGYLVYKIAVLGSVYGVIRLSINKLHDWATKRQRIVDVTGLGCISTDVASMLKAQIMRLPHNRTYIHASDVQELAKAIDYMMEKKK